MEKMSDAHESLYKKILMHHYRDHTNRRLLQQPFVTTKQMTRSCGDRVELHVNVDNAGFIRDISFSGDGCSICIASASILCDTVRSQSLQDSLGLAEMVILFFEDATNTPKPFPEQYPIKLSEDSYDALQALSGVRAYGARIPCALLAWKSFSDTFKDNR